MSVIYLLSALPRLEFGQPPSRGTKDLGTKDLGTKDLGTKDLGTKDLGTKDFLLRACEWMKRDEYKDLSALMEGRWREVVHSFGEQWGAVVELMRAVKASERLRLRGLETKEHGLRWPSRVDLGLIRRVEQAFEEPHPLARERAFDRIAWEALEELEGVDPHDVRRVFSYGLKLPIAHRWVARSPTAGTARLESWLEQRAIVPEGVNEERR